MPLGRGWSSAAGDPRSDPVTAPQGPSCRLRQLPGVVTFEEVAVDFTAEEWERLTPAQKDLHRSVMLESYLTWFAWSPSRCLYPHRRRGPASAPPPWGSPEALGPLAHAPVYLAGLAASSPCVLSWLELGGPWMGHGTVQTGLCAELLDHFTHWHGPVFSGASSIDPVMPQLWL
ncbi:uncharacterized protein [Notamacropus eugenii]|uniref:uncharacterized protein isoform X2 n=1 Tax=Notamacropus eugenii TaxID=9315 RepID=UPI003B672002